MMGRIKEHAVPSGALVIVVFTVGTFAPRPAPAPVPLGSHTRVWALLSMLPSPRLPVYQPMHNAPAIKFTAVGSSAGIQSVFVDTVALVPRAYP